MRRQYVVCLALLAAIVAAPIVVAWSKEAECRAAGGVRMRPLFGAWQCYAADSLKPVKKEGDR